MIVIAILMFTTLLDAAAALLTRGETLTFAALAAEAGVSRSTVYKHFPNREALVAALVDSGRIAAELAATPDVRERLLDAVGVVLARKGLAALTLEDVATEAGVGAVTVYRRFGDRKGLLQAYVAERSPRRLVHSLPMDGSGDRDANLLVLARESLSFLRQHRALFALLFSSDPEARALMAEAREGSTSVRELTARFLDVHFPDPSGRTVWAFHGLLIAVAWAGTGDEEADARFIVTTFLHGVSR